MSYLSSIQSSAASSVYGSGAAYGTYAAGPKGYPGSSKAGRPENTDDPGAECQTCKRRKYQDGSDEMVSFKTAQHISPESAASAVRAHEQEHVSNAYKKAAMDDGKVGLGRRRSWSERPDSGDEEEAEGMR